MCIDLPAIYVSFLVSELDRLRDLLSCFIHVWDMGVILYSIMHLLALLFVFTSSIASFRSDVGLFITLIYTMSCFCIVC